jgi:hypothetical protein
LIDDLYLHNKGNIVKITEIRGIGSR